MSASKTFKKAMNKMNCRTVEAISGDGDDILELTSIKKTAGHIKRAVRL